MSVPTSVSFDRQEPTVSVIFLPASWLRRPDLLRSTFSGLFFLASSQDTSVELSREELIGITGLSPESVAGRGGSAEKQAEEQAGVRGDASGAGDRNRGVSLGKGEEN